MRFKTATHISLVVLLTFAGACGDDSSSANNNTNNSVAADCERRQMQDFDDCNYGDFGRASGASFADEVEGFCQSTCDKVEAFLVDGSSARNLSFANGLVEAIGPLKIVHNENLESLEGLEDLRVAGANVSEIVGNSKLDDLKELQSLERVKGDQFTIAYTSLATLDGLQNLEQVDGHLVIEDNPNLTDLRALESLQSIGGGLFLQNNGKLPECEIQWLIDRAEIEGEITLYNNGGETDADCS